jgi:PAS domain S-box-containing protein
MLKSVFQYIRPIWFFLLFTPTLIILPINTDAKKDIHLSAKQHAYEIGPYCEILEDRDGHLDMMDVSARSLNGLFKPFGRISANLGRTSSTYWLRFHISAEDILSTFSNRDSWLLDLSGYNVIKFDEIQVYAQMVHKYLGGSTPAFRVEQGGSSRYMDNQPWVGRHSVVRLPEPEAAPLPFYVKVKTTGTMFLAPRIYTVKYFNNMLAAKTIFTGLYFGALVTMMIFNLIAFFALQLKTHLYYVLWLLSAMLYFAAYDGLTFDYLFIGQVMAARKLLFVSVGLGAITLSLLTRSMLMTREASPKLDSVLIGLCFFGVLHIIGVTILSQPTVFRLSSLLICVSTGLALFAGIKRWSQGFKSAKIFLLAISLSALGIFFHVTLYNSHLLPLNLFTANFLQIASFLEALLFSLALVSIWRASRSESQKLELQYSMLMKSSQNPVLVVDRKKNPTYVNPAFENIFGWNEREVLKTGLALWTDRQLDGVTEALGRLKNGNQIITLDTRLNTKSGLPIDLHISAAPLLDDRQRFLGSILVMQDITRFKKIEQDLAGKRDQLRALSAQLTKAEENEQRRISMELHDGLGQQLAAIKIILNNILRQHPNQMRQELEDVLTTVEESISSVRALSSQLNPLTLISFGLGPALMRMAENFSQRFGIDILCTDACIPDSIPLEAQSLLFRSISELVFNAVKHSDCSQINIDSKNSDGRLEITVKDNGKGFDYHNVRLNTSGLGLLSMNERLRYFEGSMSITSKSGHGTHVTLSMPIIGDLKGADNGHPNSTG